MTLVVSQNEGDELKRFLVIKPTRHTNFSKCFYFGMKFSMFQTVPLSIIRSFPLYTQQWYLSYWFADSLQAGSAAKLYDLYHCYVYSEKLLMMDRGTL
jgi:hypothetical protein